MSPGKKYSIVGRMGISITTFYEEEKCEFKKTLCGGEEDLLYQCLTKRRDVQYLTGDRIPDS